MEGWSGGVFRAPPGSEASGAPSLSGVADGVAGFLKEVGVGGKFCRKGAMNITSFFEPPDRLASKNGGAGGPACWSIAECMGEA